MAKQHQDDEEQFDSLGVSGRILTEAEQNRNAQDWMSKRREEQAKNTDAALKGCMGIISKQFGKSRADELRPAIKELLNGARSVSVRRRVVRGVG